MCWTVGPHASGGNHGAAMLVEPEMLNTLPLAGMIRPMKGLQGVGFSLDGIFKEKIKEERLEQGRNQEDRDGTRKIECPP